MAPRPKSQNPSKTAKTSSVKHKRRYCREPGCNRIVKSQGLCQRHGAKPRKCKVEGCEKQAQGNFDGMCKSHFKAHKRKTTPLPQRAPDALEPPPPEGESVYDRVLPESLMWQSDGFDEVTDEEEQRKTSGELGSAQPEAKRRLRRPPEQMPLIVHLKAGFDGLKPPAWHRNEERRARGLWPVHNPATQLEGWERELVWLEILVLTGNPASSFRHLARGWGRDKGFHMVLAQFICERHGDVERKKRERMLTMPPGMPTITEQEVACAMADSANGPGAKEAAAPSPRHPSPVKGGVPAQGSAPAVSAAACSANAWDETCYGDLAYNEAMVADLQEFLGSDSRATEAESYAGVGQTTRTTAKGSSVEGSPGGRTGALGEKVRSLRTVTATTERPEGELLPGDGTAVANTACADSAHGLLDDQVLEDGSENVNEMVEQLAASAAEAQQLQFEEDDGRPAAIISL